MRGLNKDFQSKKKKKKKAIEEGWTVENVYQVSETEHKRPKLT